jgi:hypothetical protein
MAASQDNSSGVAINIENAVGAARRPLVALPVCGTLGGGLVMTSLALEGALAVVANRGMQAIVPWVLGDRSRDGPMRRKRPRQHWVNSTKSSTSATARRFPVLRIWMPNCFNGLAPVALNASQVNNRLQ